MGPRGRMNLGVLSLLLMLGAMPSVAGESGVAFAQPGGVARLQVDLRPGPRVVFNRNGPSRVKITGPFGAVAELKLARGTPWPEDPKNYDETVPPLVFEVKVPTGTAPGSYPLKLTSELYLCDAVRHACYRTRPQVEARLDVGSAGESFPVVIALEIPGATRG